jgi:phenylacetate-CoA ligase
MREIRLPSSDPLLRQAETNALRLAQEAAAHVPAYARFLRLAGYDADRLRGVADFRALPVMDKESYLTRYPLLDRCRQRELTRANRATLSSGSSDEPTIWPRFPEQGARMVGAVFAMLQDHWRIRERWTLFVVTAGIGSWGFGASISQAGASIFARPDMRGTMVTPGLDQEQALGFVERLSPQYDQTIIVGYPAPTAHLLEAGARRGIAWPALNVGVLASGEYIPDGLRARVVRQLGKDPERLEGLVGVFGSSEVSGMIGYETHLCLLLRLLCAKTPALNEALFGSPMIPSINQYNPLGYFLQVENDEILLTQQGAVPLVRYNTRDRGGLLTLETVVARCRDFGYDLAAELQARGFGPGAIRALPFLYVFGRTDGVIIHGVNIYHDEVGHVLEEAELSTYQTGNFEIAASADAEGRATLDVSVELRPGLAPSDELHRMYRERLLSGLQQVSSIFRAVYDMAQGRIAVDVDLLPYGALEAKSPKRPRSALAPDAPASGNGAGSADA